MEKIIERKELKNKKNSFIELTVSEFELNRKIVYEYIISVDSVPWCYFDEEGRARVVFGLICNAPFSLFA